MEDNKQYNQDQIDAYLLGELSGADLERFEKAMAEQADLAREVQEQRALLEGLWVKGNEQLRSRLQRIQREVAEEGKSPGKGSGIAFSKLDWSSCRYFDFGSGWFVFFTPFHRPRSTVRHLLQSLPLVLYQPGRTGGRPSLEHPQYFVSTR